jgi:hypothetical protein
MLLWREQRDIIGHFYETMRHRHGIEGQMFTYAMTLFGAPSIPGAHSEAEVYPVVLRPVLPARAVSVTTPLAEGNIAALSNRWRLIEHDTLPAYLKYVREHGDDARAQAQTPIGARVGKYRLISRFGVIAAAAVTRWRVSLGARARSRRAQRAQPTIENGDTVVLDLGNPEDAEGVWASFPGPSCMWTSTRRHHRSVEVRVPDQAVFRAQAETIAVLKFGGAPHPNHVAVTLAPTDLDATERRLREYAADWQIDIAQVHAWKQDAEKLDSSPDRTHSTRILRRSPIGFVHLEFEVSHHVRERQFHIAALFSW